MVIRQSKIIDPLTGQIVNGHGAEASRDIYENNLATPGNPLETRLLYDPLDQRPEVQTREDYSANGQLIGVSKLYNDFTSWLTGRNLNDAHLSKMDKEAVTALSQEIERSAFHGGATPTAAPSVLSYEQQFGPGYDFGAGTFDIDPRFFDLDGNGVFETADVSLEGFEGTYDSSWLDWQPTLTSNVGWITSIFDGWDFSFFEPIVLDLNGDGVDIRPRTDSTVYINADADAAKEQTAWVGPTDGLLVLDLAANGAAGADGQVTQRREFAFADWTTNPNDTDAQALRTLFDSNGDGKLTVADTRWPEFRVWQDANQNGTVEAGEMTTLAARGITEINLTTDGRAFQLPDGSKINGTGSFIQNGVVKSYADTALAFDPQGFSRVVQSYGFDYVGEDGVVKKFIDASIFKVNASTGQPDPNGVAASNFNLNFAINVGTNVLLQNDGVLSGNGNDQLIAYGTKAVTLFGNNGNDYVEGGDGNDVIDGGAGVDTLLGGLGDDTIFFDAQDFQTGVGRLIDGGAGYDTAIWTSTIAANVIMSQDNVEAFIGNSGNDTISGGNIHLGPSNSNLGATNIGAFIDGRSGNDSITGSVNDDILLGGIGTDTLIGGTGGDLLQGGADNDTLNGQDGDDALWGGDGQDVLGGGSGADTQNGDNGADTLDGGLGNDVLDGGLGADVLNGGDGVDTLSYAAASSGAGVLLYMLAANLNGGDAAGDTYTGIENVIGTSVNDRIYMDNGNNGVEGGGGVFDTAELYAGNDSYLGGAGYDYVLAGAGNDVIEVGTGGSLIYGEADHDRITAMSGSNELSGGTGDDTVTGGTGQDVIFGGAGSDTLTGGDGGDFLFGETGNDTLRGGGGNDQVFGGSDQDQLFGDAGIDILDGGDGNDVLSDLGTGELSFLIGGAGNDTLIGTTGQDQMWGGTGSIDTGADMFQFRAGNGFDIIFDFQAGMGVVDQIRLLDFGLTSFAQLQAENRIGQAGANTQINLPGSGNVIFLMNTTATTLVADDFLFG